MSVRVSWLVVERGWQVVGRDGDLGTVHDVVGDAEKDIFHGIAVKRGAFSRARVVPAARVTAITDGRIEVAVTSEELERLDEHGTASPA